MQQSMVSWGAACVLIADDDVKLAKGLERVLCARGLHVEVVHSGTAVVNYMTSAYGGHAGIRVPDLIVSDLNMPGCSGFDLLAMLRARTWTGSRATASPSLLLMTGESNWSVELRARQLGAVGVLFKPFTMDQFLAETTAALDGASARRAS